MKSRLKATWLSQGVDLMLKEVMGVIMTAGEMLLTSGAEVYRAEETMERMGRALGYTVEAYVTPTGIMATVAKDGRYLTKIRRVRMRSQDLGKIAGVNQISRELAAGLLDLAETKNRLNQLKSPTYNLPTQFFAVMVASLSLTFMLGGRQLELVVAAGAGFLAYAVDYFLSRLSASTYLRSFAAAFVVASAASSARLLLPDISVPQVIVGGLMVLVPGVAMASAVRDLVQGELLSGVVRVVEAVAIAAALAAGSAVAVGFWRF